MYEKTKLCVWYVYVCFFFKTDKWALGWNWRKKFYVLFNQMGSMFFKIFTKVSLNNVVWNLKTGKRGFPNSILPNTFFLELQFSVFKYWKLLFRITYQTNLVLLSKKMPKHMISSRSSSRDNRLRSVRIKNKESRERKNIRIMWFILTTFIYTRKPLMTTSLLSWIVVWN